MPPTSTSCYSDAIVSNDCVYDLKFVAYCVVGPIIIVVGMVGNVLNLLILSRPNMQGVTYTYLKSLATVDLANMFFAIPTFVGATRKGPSPYGLVFFFAHFDLLIANSLLAVSDYIVLAVTVDRYLSVAFPTRFRDFHNNRQVCKVIVTSCLLAVLVNLPVCWYFDVMEVPETFTGQFNCSYVAAGFYNVKNKEVIEESWWKPYVVVQQLILRVIPAIAIVILNFLLLSMFRRVIGTRSKLLCARTVVSSSETEFASNLSVSVPPPPPANALAQEETRLVIVLTIFSVIVLCALTPAALVYYLFMGAQMDNESIEVFRVVANVLEYLNSALNFYLYCMTCKKIRQNMSKLFCGWTLKRRLLQHTVTPDKLQLNRQTAASSGDPVL